MRRTGGARAVVLAVLTVALAGGCAGAAVPAGGSADPCAGDPPAEVVDHSRGGPEDPESPEVMAWQDAAIDALLRLEPLAGDRFAGSWLQWDPEQAAVVLVTAGPPVERLEAAAAAAEVAVDVRYTARVTHDELLAAMDAVGPEMSTVPGVAGYGLSASGNRVVVDVAAGDDGGAAACAEVADLFADLGVPVGFEVFDGPVESTVRTTVGFGEAYDHGDGRVSVNASSCNGEPEVVGLEQDVDEVRVEIEATVPAPGWGGNACLDGVEVRLDAPLGDRTLVDVSSGEAVAVRRAVGER